MSAENSFHDEGGKPAINKNMEVPEILKVISALARTNKDKT